VTGDPFETAAIRHAVLAAWAATPIRFREDANAEEDLVAGGYRDRVVVELAQNAADAAAAAGRPGRLLLALRELDGQAVLVAANTGHPLSASGVQALCTLRASAKRDGDTVGRFGVGFSAVLAVSDEPAVLSRGGGARFSSADTHDLVVAAAREAPALAEELARRDGHVPVLRLPFPADGTPPEGYDTAVLLPLRDAPAEDLVQRMLEETGDPLLLALPALAEIRIEQPGRAVRTLADVERRWHVVRSSGVLDPRLLADRPTEERGRSAWQVTWAVPVEPGLPGPAPVLHAPTPTEEPLSLPGVLVATLPLEPSRRHVAPGPATDAVLDAAASAYAELVTARAAAGAEVWPLIPTGLATGAIDAGVRARLDDVLPATPMLRAAEDPAILLRPRDAVALEDPAGADPGLVAALAPTVAGLVLAPRAATAPLARLGVRRLGLADLTDALPEAPPPWWRTLYAALEQVCADPLVRESLAGLPVPLADGRTVHGPRGVLLLDLASSDEATQEARADSAAALAALGVRVVHPQAAHAVLARLGAVVATPRAVLDLPAVRAAAEQSPDAEDPDAVAAAVLDLVAAAGSDLAPGDLPWLADLALRDADGDLAPAGALALPDSPAADLFDPDEIGVVDGDLARRWGPAVLAACGVLTGLAVVRGHDVPLDPAAEPHEGPWADLDGWPEWVEHALAAPGGGPGDEPVLAELLAVRDLDAVRPDRLTGVPAALAADPVTRPALTGAARVVHRAGAYDVVPHAAWWLRRRLLEGPVADPDAGADLTVLLPPAPAWLAGLDAPIRRSLGAVTDLADLDLEAVAGLLDRLAMPDLDLPTVLVVRIYRRVADMGESADAEPPDRVRVVDGAGTRVVSATAAYVAESPMYRQRGDLGHPVPAPPGRAEDLAELLDLPLGAEVANGEVGESGPQGSGVRRPVPPQAVEVLPGCPATWCEHDVLSVDGHEVEWWVDSGPDDPRVHASTMRGLARGLAWAGGAWDRRFALAEVLLDPGAAAEIAIDDAYSG
jgi:hypothetical protein